MEKSHKTPTREEVEVLSLIKKEKTIEAKELLQEIAVLLPDYFIAEFEGGDTSLKINFCNGQSFLLTVAEAA